MKLLRFVVGSFIGAFLLLTNTVTNAQTDSTIVDLAVATDSLSTLVDLVTLADLVETLAGDGPFTVLAPTNDAFAELDTDLVESLTDDPSGALTDVLLYHVIPGKVMSSDLEDGAMVETVNGANITVSLGDIDVMFNDAKYVTGDIEASNGVVHIIDKVLIPPSEEETTGDEEGVDTEEMEEEETTEATIVDLAVATDSLSTLVDLVTLAELVETLAGEGPFTVLAPTNDAFAELDTDTVAALTDDPSGALTDVLLYHVIPGKVMSSDLEDGAMVETVNGANITVSLTDIDVMFNDAKYVTGDIAASNGVVHIIDKVLIPPAEEETTGDEEGMDTEEMEEEESTEATIVDLAVDTDDLSTLVDLVTLAELVETLAGEGPFTVFAPTNAAFAELDSETVDALTADPTGALTDVLLYHVVSGTVLSSDLEDGAMVETVNGANITVSLGDDVMINDAKVVTADVMASNGVVHIIDKVLIPPAGSDELPPPEDEDDMGDMDPDMEDEMDSPSQTIVELAVATDDLSTLVDLVTLAELVETLSSDGPFTVFAPTNDAFAELDDDTVDALKADPSGALTDVLLYHVVPGKVLSSDLEDGATADTVNGASVMVALDDAGAMINDANVVAADVMASNGVVHIIDKVLIPPAAEEEAAVEESESEDTEDMEEEGTSEATIVELAVATDDLSTLVDLVTLAELVETLSSEGPFTVFAPTNAAFEELDSETVDALTADPSGALTDVLLYHVVPGKVLSSDLEDGAMVDTVNGASVEVSLDDDGAMINDANVVTADIMASNGVVHIINKVLIPPSTSEADTPADESASEESGDFQRLKSVFIPADACMEVLAVQDKERVYLRDCEAEKGGWSYDESSGLFALEMDPDYCMQADFDPVVGTGKPIRIMPCDPEEPLQQFMFVEGEAIKAKSDTDFCVHWRGENFFIGSGVKAGDPMILKDCKHIEDSLGWEFD